MLTTLVQDMGAFEMAMSKRSEGNCIAGVNKVVVYNQRLLLSVAFPRVTCVTVQS